MQRLVWLTDIHLDFCDEQRVATFLETVGQQGATGVLIGGDIGEADQVQAWLERMQAAWQLPVYFVLGNHDFYGGSIAAVRGQMSELTAREPGLKYLSIAGPIDLGEGWALVGHDGWADGRIGNFLGSVVMMRDYVCIAELTGLDRQQRWQRLMAEADQAAEIVERQLRSVLATHRQLLMLTHVPPFRDACWYEGEISDDHWAPHFTCQAIGEAIRDVMRTHPDHRLTVLCGHTHGRGYTQPLPNVAVYTGGAQYGAPQINQIIELTGQGPRLT